MIITDENIQQPKNLRGEYIWLVISRDGVAMLRNLPIIKLLILANRVKIVLRDENEELMKLFLTNKKKSIPIVIVVDKATVVSWKMGTKT
jgi:hypothetical protein